MKSWHAEGKLGVVCCPHCTCPLYRLMAIWEALSSALRLRRCFATLPDLQVTLTCCGPIG